MTLDWTESIDGTDWHELEALYRAAPLGNKTAAQLRTAFTNSIAVCLIRERGKLVGAGRVVGDGVDIAYLGDVALMPAHQGRGLGVQIVQRLMERARGHKKIILYSVPGKEGFYKRFGFKRMTTAMAVFDNQAGALERGYLSDT